MFGSKNFKLEHRIKQLQKRSVLATLQEVPDALEDILEITTSTAYPTTANITEDAWALWWNSATSIMRLYINDGGTLRYVQFTNVGIGTCVYDTGVYDSCIYA